MIKLNDDQLKQVAEFSSNLGLVVIATVITPAFSNIVNINSVMIISGLVIAGFCLFLSLFTLRNRKNG